MGRFDPNAYGNPMAKELPRRTATLGTTSAAVIRSLPSEAIQDKKQHGNTEHYAIRATQDQETFKSTQSIANGTGERLENIRRLSSDLLNSKYAPNSATEDRQSLKSTAKSWNHGIGDPPASGSFNGKRSVVVLDQNIPLSAQEQSDIISTSPNHKPKIDSVATSSENLPHTLHSFGSSSLVKQANIKAVPLADPDPQNTIETPKMKKTSPNTSKRDPVSSTLVTQNGQQLSMEEQLSQARGASLKKIQARIKTKDKGSTASLRDLSLARKPVFALESINPAGRRSSASGAWSKNQPNMLATTSSSIPPVGQHDRNLSTANTAVNQRVSHVERRRPAHSSKSRGGPGGFPEQEANYRRREEETSNPRKASRADLKPVEMDADSNAWGSSVPSDASQASNDSIQPLHFGKALVCKSSERPHPLVAWDGSMQPPPSDWDDRPRFNNNSPEFRDDFQRWTYDVCQMMTGAYDKTFAPIPPSKLQDCEKIPNGISMVPKDLTINMKNAESYGYDDNSAEEAIKYAQPMVPEDFEDWGKIDMSRPENIMIQHETTEELVSNWIKHSQERRKLADAEIEQQSRAADILLNPAITPNPNQPILNIYLRPAYSIDATRMTEIYNWYIENSPRTAETRTIGEDEMRDRLDDSRSTKLPFIVAMERNAGGALSHNLEAQAQTLNNNSGPIENIDPMRKVMLAKENIVGWACAEQFTAMDYVERISAELSVYVDPAYRQLGIGRCLMDKLIDSCDRGYRKRGGYAFCCPQEARHLYSSGGGCDLHKLVFIFRKWKYPKNVSARSVAHKHPNANRNKKAEDRENDYDLWLRKWLESWDFEVEGMLKGAGAKNGRFIDVVHFSRETKWQPAEGRIPDPVPYLE